MIREPLRSPFHYDHGVAERGEEAIAFGKVVAPGLRPVLELAQHDAPDGGVPVHVPR